MFTRKHEIWKFADVGDELDDLLPYAEDLVRKWSAQDVSEVKFENTFQIILASLLLMDDLLPPSARKAFAQLTLQTISETTEKKIRIDVLGITPPAPGRKRDPNTHRTVIRGVNELLQSGVKKSKAYELIAGELFKSQDTVRRIYERYKKKQESKIKNQIETGEIKK